MQKLQEQGWYVSEHGYDLASDFGSIGDVQKMIKRAVDMDLREIGSGQGDITKGNLVLQIQKLRNIAAPKYNEESRTAPRMFKMSLTDGKNNYQAIEINQISGLGFNTPPGTKLLLKCQNIVLSHGIVLLGSENVDSVLGGKVTNLIEKWELNRKLATHSRLRSVEEGGPPPWIPFGKKIIKGDVERDKNFKALGKDSSDKETTEFEAQRQDAIAEAARLGGKKVFGGGNKQLLDHSVQRIVDQGFSVEQAEYALRISRNHVDRALKSLQRTNENRSGGGREPREAREPRPKRFEKKTEETAKPSSGKVSLFDFLEDKLPAQSETSDAHGNSQQHQYSQRSNDNNSNYRLENHFERLELRGSEHSQAGKGGRTQKSGRAYQAPPRHAIDETKYSKRSSHESHNSFPSSNTFSNSHQSRPPRFQRNQEIHGNYQHDSVFRGNNSRSYQSNERKNAAPAFSQSRGDIGTFNSNDSPIFATKNHQSHDKNAKSYQQTDSRYQHVDSEPKNKQVSGHDASHGRPGRGQQDAAQKTQASNAIDKNSAKSQSHKAQHAIATNESDRSKNVNGRGTNNESAGGTWAWKLGDDCMAKYWEDNRYYNAQVTAISARTCVVRFKDFDNYEEVLQADCIPITEKPQEFTQSEMPTRRSDQRGYGNRQARNDQSDNHISGMEFRRGGGGGNGNLGTKGYNRKRGQQRSAQPIYQPPAQRGHSSSNWNARDNPPV